MYMMYGNHYISIIHRWKFIYRSNARKYTLGSAKCGLHNQVVFIYWWSLEQIGLFVCVVESIHVPYLDI